jgi:hypothetical protein
MMNGWVTRGVVAQLFPFEKDFASLTWRPNDYDGEIPPYNTESRRGANLSKHDPGYFPWRDHNGLQLVDNDWDLNIAYYSNQPNHVPLTAPPVILLN